MSVSGTSRQFGLAAPMSGFGVIADITLTDPHGAASDPKGLLLPVAGFDSDNGIYRNKSIRHETFYNDPMNDRPV
jgi:hypothetical protein